MQEENTTAIAKLENQTKRRGYKKTKLGWIPEEWSTPTIPEIFQFLKTTSFSRNQMNYDENDGVYCIHYGDIHATYQRPILDFNENSEIPKINNDVELRSNIDLLEDGDLIIADASEDYEGIGTAIELTNLNGKEVLSGLHTFAFRDNKGKTVQGFRSYLFRNPQVKKALKIIATGSKVYGVSKGNLERFRIVLPTPSEQQKIAKILSTWDTAIDTQEQLIATKQTLKKGLMQALLTGKKRFEGFEREWKEFTLNECCSVKGKYGIGAAAVNFTNDLPRYLRITDINDDGQYSPDNEVCVDDSGWEDYLLAEGDIVFARTGNTTGKSYLYNPKDGVLVYAGFLIKFRPKKNVLNPAFLKYYTETKPYWDWIKTMSVRSGQPGINSVEYGKLKLPLPCIGEQQKIASVLRDADKEIELLKWQLTQLQSQKRGLMQRLLTGVIRVKI